MSYRCFNRESWRIVKSKFGGSGRIEPFAVPQDTCRTVATFDTQEEAREFCGERNARRKSRCHACPGPPAPGVNCATQGCLVAPWTEYTEVTDR